MLLLAPVPTSLLPFYKITKCPRRQQKMNLPNEGEKKEERKTLGARPKKKRKNETDTKRPVVHHKYLRHGLGVALLSANDSRLCRSKERVDADQRGEYGL